jgi:hypothetical protein
MKLKDKGIFIIVGFLSLFFLTTMSPTLGMAAGADGRI